MKKLKFNSTLNHKQSDYKTHEVIVKKVITLYGKNFSELKDHPLSDNSYITQNHDLMYIDSNYATHCLLMVDYDSGDGILVESEGCGCPVDTSALAEAPTEATAETSSLKKIVRISKWLKVTQLMWIFNLISRWKPSLLMS